MLNKCSFPLLKAIIQNILLFLLALPTHNALISTGAPTSLVLSDYVLAFLSLVTLALEFTADNQQYAYQTFKHSGREEGDKVSWPGAKIEYTEEDKKRGFITKGLWKWSRHPNFACEQTFWVRLFKPRPIAKRIDTNLSFNVDSSKFVPDSGYTSLKLQISSARPVDPLLVHLHALLL